MSASVTLTIRPGSERGAEHVNGENRYPAPPPIIPPPFESAPDGPPPPIAPDPVGLPEPQPARAKPATAVVSASRFRNTTRRRIHPEAIAPRAARVRGIPHKRSGKPGLRRPQTRHPDPLLLAHRPRRDRMSSLRPAERRGIRVEQPSCVHRARGIRLSPATSLFCARKPRISPPICFRLTARQPRCASSSDIPADGTRRGSGDERDSYRPRRDARVATNAGARGGDDVISQLPQLPRSESRGQLFSVRSAKQEPARAEHGSSSGAGARTPSLLRPLCGARLSTRDRAAASTGPSTARPSGR